jgi:glyoxylase-like metal-dependent hydrolase (beta-lactamase superfamily II)
LEPLNMARMRFVRHGDHLIQLIRSRLSNAYVVREPDGITVIDTSLPGSEDPIRWAADALGLPIRRILLSHAHLDHYGSLDALHAAVPDAEVLVSARDAKLLRGDLSREPGEPEGFLFPGFFKPAAETRPTRTIAEGERIGSLEVIAAPGHTPGQLAFLDHRDATLVCGDAYLALGGLFVTTQPVLRFPFPALLGTWHKPTAYATAVKLRELSPRRLATGHGRVLTDPVPEMERAIREAPQS